MKKIADPTQEKFIACLARCQPGVTATGLAVACSELFSPPTTELQIYELLRSMRNPHDPEFRGFFQKWYSYVCKKPCCASKEEDGESDVEALEEQLPEDGQVDYDDGEDDSCGNELNEAETTIQAIQGTEEDRLIEQVEELQADISYFQDELRAVYKWLYRKAITDVHQRLQNLALEERAQVDYDDGEENSYRSELTMADTTIQAVQGTEEDRLIEQVEELQADISHFQEDLRVAYKILYRKTITDVHERLQNLTPEEGAQQADHARNVAFLIEWNRQNWVFDHTVCEQMELAGLWAPGSEVDEDKVAQFRPGASVKTLLAISRP